MYIQCTAESNGWCRINGSRLSCAASEKMKSFPNLSPRQLEALVRLPAHESHRDRASRGISHGLGAAGMGREPERGALTETPLPRWPGVQWKAPGGGFVCAGTQLRQPQRVVPICSWQSNESRYKLRGVRKDGVIP